MIKLPCSCGKADCENSVTVDEQAQKVWIDHMTGGKGLLIYSTASRLRRFAEAILQALPRDVPRGRKP